MAAWETPLQNLSIRSGLTRVITRVMMRRYPPLRKCILGFEMERK